MKNPIYNELLKLNLIKKSRLIILNNKTRDKKINVIQDCKTKIIFLEKFITNKNYYSTLKYGDKNKKNLRNKETIIINLKTSTKYLKLKALNDDYRRVKQFKKLLKNKDILDFGCGWGSFLIMLKKYKSLNGVELRKECLDYIITNFKKINIENSINSFKKKFDLITMFHVLEHIPFQIKTLKMLKSKLKKGGRIIIEVPHAEDFLISQNELKEFKNFTFWSEHLILHTHASLKTILVKSGFKKISIQYYQRYNFSNHLGWFIKKKPDSDKFYKNLINKKLNKNYCENLKKIKQTDTLIAIAQ